MKQIISLTFAVLFFLATLGAYAYLMYEVTVAVDSLAVAREQVNSVGQRSAATSARERFVADTEGERAALGEYIIRDADVVTPIETIERAANREDVTIEISSVSTESIPDWKYHEGIRVTLSAEGSYRELVHFASALETLPFAARLERFALESGEDAWFATYLILIPKGNAL